MLITAYDTGAVSYLRHRHALAQHISGRPATVTAVWAWYRALAEAIVCP